MWVSIPRAWREPHNGSTASRAAASTRTSTAARAPTTSTQRSTNKPDPSPGEINHPPYYAVKMVPGDLCTKGGVRTDVHARALRDDGSVIEVYMPQAM